MVMHIRRHGVLPALVAAFVLMSAWSGACSDAPVAILEREEPQSAPAVSPAAPKAAEPRLQEYAVPRGNRPHEVAPAVDGGVWYTAQGSGELGWLDPATGETRLIPLGRGSAPHGVIVGPDGAAWVTDSGLNAIVRVDPRSAEVRLFPVPGRNINLNTATFDARGILWFTGQAGAYGRLDPASGAMQVFDAPRGRGPYGIATTPAGGVYYASLAGSHIARIDTATGAATPIDPPTAGQGARRIWSDSAGVLWVSEWDAGQLGRYDPATGEWAEWRLPGERPRPYAVYVDERDHVWLSDHALGRGSDGGSNTLLHFDPTTEAFTTITGSAPLRVAQLGGVPGEVWGADRDRQHVVVVRY